MNVKQRNSSESTSEATITVLKRNGAMFNMPLFVEFVLNMKNMQHVLKALREFLDKRAL